MNKGIFCILVCMLMLLTTVVPISVTTSWKKTSQPLNMGNILYVGGSGPGNYTNIQDAINASSNGDTVFVYNGIYKGGIVVNRSISLLGENKLTTIIDDYDHSPGDVVTISSDNVQVSGFTIGNNSVAILVLSNSCDISNNLLNYVKNIGVDIKGNNNKIHDNEVTMMGTGIGCGIGLIGCYNNTIAGNTIHGFLFGIKVQSCPANYPNSIQKNRIYNSGQYGIFINLLVTNLLISGNYIVGCERGIFFSWDSQCNKINILFNTIENSTDIGLYFEYPKSTGSVHNLICRNTFINNNVDFTFKLSKTRLHFFLFNNYWEKPHFLPVLLSGSQDLGFGIAFHTYKIDLMPAKIPLLFNELQIYYGAGK